MIKWCACLQGGISKSLVLSVYSDFFWEWNQTLDGFRGGESYHPSFEATVLSTSLLAELIHCVWDTGRHWRGSGSSLAVTDSTPCVSTDLSNSTCPKRTSSLSPSPPSQTCCTHDLSHLCWQPFFRWVGQNFGDSLDFSCLSHLNNTPSNPIDSTVRTCLPLLAVSRAMVPLGRHHQLREILQFPPHFSLLLPLPLNSPERAVAVIR